MDREQTPTVGTAEATPGPVREVTYMTPEEQSAHLKMQGRQALGTQPRITCECGKTIPMRFLFRCLYCSCFLCTGCAEIHFGKTRAQYKAERAASGAAP